jgi:signal transduction histidine kinase
MFRLGDVSIRKKLNWVIMSTCAVALLLACVAFVGYEWVTFHHTMPRDQGTLAQIVGANCAAAVVFNDEKSAERTLGALRAEPHVVAACLYTPDGRLFATYARQDLKRWKPPALPEDGAVFGNDRLTVVQPVILDNERVATVYLESDLRAMQERLLRYACIVATVLLVALLVAWVLSARLQRIVSDPILHLVETSKAVSDKHDYTLRAKRYGRDELGLLVDAFNHMLAQIQQRDDALQRSNRELQDFAYVASHDLQEPLRKIQAFGDRLKTKFVQVLSDDGRDYLERMQNAASRMQTLINDLLTFSRVTTKAQAFVPVDLCQVAREVLSDLEVRIEQTGACVEVGALATVDADPLQMRQLLQNLIGNALKFRREYAKPEIKVTAHANGDDRCQLTVQDNGIGFDMKYVERIFGMFQRLHGRDQYEGTGVGLAICRKIAERHGGNITAQSSPGQGATFIVTLPAHHTNGAHQP